MPLTLKVNSRGQVTLPAEIRRRYHIEPGSKFQLNEEPEKLVLEYEEPGPYPVTEGLVELLAQTGLSSKDYELIRKWRDEEEADFQELLNQP